MLMKMRAMMKKEDNQKGFTIVELIIVMAILAVLAAIAVPKFSTVLTDSKSKADTANVKLIEESLDLYVANEADKTGYTAPAVNDVITASSPVVTKGYLKEAPKYPVDTTKGYKITSISPMTVVHE